MGWAVDHCCFRLKVAKHLEVTVARGELPINASYPPNTALKAVRLSLRCPPPG